MNPLTRLISSSVVVVLLLGAVFSFGYISGKHLGDLALEDYISRGKELALENSIRVRELERTHQKRESELLAQLTKQKEDYEKNISNIYNDYNHRLLQHKNRADSYREQLESGDCIGSGIIEHTVQMDSALEEGIHMVKELSEAVRLLEREVQIRDEIIKNDRRTINEKR